MAEPPMIEPAKGYGTVEVAILVAMAREGEWLNADACAFLLGMLTPKGKINRRGFLERVAPRGSFPKPLQLGGEKKWRRAEVIRWADDEKRIQGLSSTSGPRRKANEVVPASIAVPEERWVWSHALENRVGFRKSTLYRWIKQGKFPAPVKFGISSFWNEAEIEAWELAREAELNIPVDGGKTR